MPRSHRCVLRGSSHEVGGGERRVLDAPKLGAGGWALPWGVRLRVGTRVRARNSVVAGHAAFRYSLMRPSQRVVLMTCVGDGGVSPAPFSAAGGAL